MGKHKAFTKTFFSSHARSGAFITWLKVVISPHYFSLSRRPSFRTGSRANEGENNEISVARDPASTPKTGLEAEMSTNPRFNANFNSGMIRAQ